MLKDTTNIPFLDSDIAIEKTTGKKIPEIFASQWESEFRDLEEKTLQDISETHQKIILATGWGIVMRWANRDMLRYFDHVIYLRTSPQSSYERTKDDVNRPLLQTENPTQTLHNLLTIRESLYQATADAIVDTDGLSPQEVAKKILEIISDSENIKIPSDSLDNSKKTL